MERQYVKDRVSVITPVYNVERYIEATLESVFAQTYKDIEIVLVDDCSKDRSAELIAKYKKNHSEIVYFLQPKNMGAGAARNKALELASGQYVAFLDSDDLWMPEKTKKQIALMKRKESPFSYTAIEMIDQKGKTIKSKRKLKESVIIDRTVLGDFRMPLRRGGQDYATWLSLLRNGTVAYGINEGLVKYRVGSNSLSSNKFKSIKQVWEIQTQDEHINKIFAAFHVGCFAFNAAKKYFL